MLEASRASSPASGGPASDLLARLYAEHVDRINAGEAIDRERILAEHPEVGEELLRRLRAFLELRAEVEQEGPLGNLGDYRLLRRVGRGGMGVVYEAWQASLERRVALKVLPAGVAADARTVSRFVREARAAAKLQHPNIVSIFGMGVEADTPYFAMEFVEGMTLAEVLADMQSERGAAPAGAGLRTWSWRSAPSPPRSEARPAGAAPEAGRPRPDHPGLVSDPGPAAAAGEFEAGALEVNARYSYDVALAFAGAADGLQHAHEHGVIHRDLKPSNLVLDGGGRLRILDFGLARVEGDQSITASGDFLGTPLYMSPEQAEARRVEVDHRTDIYSLGATLYEMLTWRPPFRGKSYQDTLTQILSRDPEPPRRLNPRLPRDLETIVLKCLRKDPGGRYGTAEALGQDLRRFVRGDPIEARPQPVSEKVLRSLRRHRLGIASAAGLVLLLVVAALLFLGEWKAARGRKLALYERQVMGAVFKLERRKLTLNTGATDWSPDCGWSAVSTVEREDFASEAGVEVVEAALAELEEAARLFPGRPDARFHRALGLYSLGRSGEALREMETLLERSPDFLPGRLYRDVLRRFDEGVRLASGGGALPGPAREAAWAEAWTAAQRAIEAREWPEAAAACDRFLHAVEETGEPYLGAALEFLLGRGQAKLEAGEVPGAILDFAAARSRWPESLESLLLLGKAWYLQGEREEARRTFEEIYRRGASAAERQDCALWIWSLYFRLRDREQCLVWVERLKPGFWRERARGGLLAGFGRPDEAEAAYDEALRLASGAVDAPHLEVGRMLLERGAAEEAAASFRRALERNPEHLWARTQLGVALERLGRRAEAVACWEEAGRRSASFTPPLFAHAEMCESEGKVEEALALYRRAVERAPRNAESHWRLAKALRRRGQIDDAIASYRRSLDLRRDPHAMNDLGAALADDKGALREAFAELVSAFELQPQAMNVVRNLAALFPKSAEPAARADLERLMGAADRVLGQEGMPPGFGDLLEALASHLAKKPAGPDDLWRARRYATHAVHLSGGADPGALAALAAVEAASGVKAEAVVTLERALRLPGATWYERAQAGRLRLELLPDLPSFASADVALERAGEDLLISERATWRFLRGREEPSEGLAWTGLEFDDGGWEAGGGPFGYGPGDAAGPLADMKDGYSTLYLRHGFTLPESGGYEGFLLAVQADDGCVAYVNGKEVLRLGVAGREERLLHDATAAVSLSTRAPVRSVRLEAGLFRPGRNVLALQGVNAALGDGDFFLGSSLKGRREPREERDREVLEAFRAAAHGQDVRARMAYIEGRIRERAGRPGEAIDFYRQAAALDGGSRPEPTARLAACLRAAAQPLEAETALGEALGRGFENDRELWNLWAAVELVDLRRRVEEALARFPRPAETAAGGAGAGEARSAVPAARHAADVRWLLEALARGEPIRIDCGGEERASPAGAAWSRDSFATGGRLLEVGPALATLVGGIAGTEDDALYRSQRTFPGHELAPPGYRVPLPPGKYRVTLHFAELRHREPGKRRFGVTLEEERVLERFDPGAAGRATAIVKAFEVQVEDGLLDVVFLPEIDHPAIAGLEIERRE